MDKKISQIAEAVLQGLLPTREQLEYLFSLKGEFLWDILYWANKIRENNFGRKVRICSIIPVRLGGCSEDCKFCAQSVKYHTSCQKVQILGDDEILAAAKKAKADGVPFFGLVYSGKTISQSELAKLEKLIAVIKKQIGIGVCAGVGIINCRQAERLKQAGLDRYNHNLETSQNYFDKIVSTHDYQSRVETIKAAKSAGLGVCAGGIFGIGESDNDRLDMAVELQQLEVDMVPVNFLHPIEGTPLAGSVPLEPMEILRIIGLYRFALPNADIKVAGGRVLNLRDLQSWLFYAGATAIISGNYLTTAGRSVKADMQMLRDLKMEPDFL